MSTQRDSKLEWNFMQVFGDKGAVDDVTEGLAFGVSLFVIPNQRILSPLSNLTIRETF